MADLLCLQMTVDADLDDEALSERVLALGGEVAELDVDEVEPAVAGEAPAGSKGLDLVAIGALVVKLGRSSRILRELIDAVRDWVSRTGTRSVRLSIGDDVLEVSGASSDEVRLLIDAWVQRHTEG